MFIINIHFFAQGQLAANGRLEVAADATAADLYKQVSREFNVPVSNFTLANPSGVLGSKTIVIENNTGKADGKDGHKLGDGSVLICTVHQAAPSKIGAWLGTVLSGDRNNQKMVLAAIEGDAETVHRLLKSGACPDAYDTSANEKGMTGLHLACANGCEDVARLLYKFGAKADGTTHESKMAPLHCVGVGGDVYMAKWLVQEAGAPVDQRNSMGCTTLHVACGNGHLPLVKWLVQHGGAQVDARENTLGGTPLISASSAGHGEIVQWLVQSGGARVSEHANTGFSGLHCACKVKHLNVVDQFIRLGAPLDQRTKDGQTALHFASAGGSLTIVRLLLQKGSKPDVKDILGRTPADIACADISDQSQKKHIQAALKEAAVEGSDKAGFQTGMRVTVKSLVTGRFAVQVETEDWKK